MTAETTHIIITGHQLQQALAYIAPDLTPRQLQDSVRIELVQQDGQSIAAALAPMDPAQPAVPLDDHLQWPQQHPDDRLVDGWASTIKDRMARRCGRNRRDIAANGRLPDGWASGSFSSCGWDSQSWSASQISADLTEHLYRQNLLEVAIHALILHERGMRFDRRQMSQVMPPQALEVAAEMRVHAQDLREEAAFPISASQLDQWADHIEAARDTPTQIPHLIAAPVMYEALKADQCAVQCERAHAALVQQARHEGWFSDQKHPGQAAIRQAAQQRWEQELRAFDLKRKAFALATPSDQTQAGIQVQTTAGASYRSLSIDIEQAETPVAAAA